jgi:glutamine---fructose-6-phosphate transaminase (isomerizing)
MPRRVQDYQLYRQIQSQRDEVERILSAPEPVEVAAETIASSSRVFTVGIGTSTNAARVAGYLLRAAGIDAVEWAAHDFVSYGPALRPDDAVVVFSHSGRKQYSQQAIARAVEAGVPTIWIAGSEAKPLGATLTLRTVAREKSAAFTVSHTVAMTLAARIADAIKPGASGDIQALPGAVEKAIELEDTAAELAREWHGFDALVAIGAGPHEASAHEVAIKVNEAARLRARGYATEQFLHGPQAQMQPGDCLLAFAAPGPTRERTAVVAQFGLDVGAPVAWIAPDVGPPGSRWIPVPDVGDLLSPIVEIIPAQWLACHLASLEDVDADNFRLDDPPFKQAFERYEL